MQDKNPQAQHPGLRTFDSSGAIPTHLSMVGSLGAILPDVTGEVMTAKRDVLPIRGLKLMRLLDKCINAQKSHIK